MLSSFLQLLFYNYLIISKYVYFLRKSFSKNHSHKGIKVSLA